MAHSSVCQQLAIYVRRWLASPVSHDPIDECGPAALQILYRRPIEALELAKSELQNRPYREVRGCWLRLYEESSLYCAADLLIKQTELPTEGKLGIHDGDDDWISRVVNILDNALIVSGAPRRHDLFDKIFTELSMHDDPIAFDGMPAELQADAPASLQSTYLVPSVEAPTLEAFQLHLDKETTPLLLTGVVDDWPALHSWHRTSHLLQLTLNGRRLVPIEIGSTYVSEDWRQEIVPFRRYLQDYLLPKSPAEIGYLGQHNLFAQISQLTHEIRTPDYCFSAPPESIPESKPGLPPIAPVDEPQMNAWLGPKGTRTPLHTDPYHNIFVQVCGYKYVRLYSPKATASLYPRGVDENGINESNTSQVDIRFDPESAGNIRVNEPSVFRGFMDEVGYMERIIGPGQCLYIPAGWWHFVESLTTSFSVSFWWN